MPASDAYAAIWDMDGTLVDTAELHFDAWLALCKELGRPFYVTQDGKGQAVDALFR